MSTPLLHANEQQLPYRCTGRIAFSKDTVANSSSRYNHDWSDTVANFKYTRIVPPPSWEVGQIKPRPVYYTCMVHTNTEESVQLMKTSAEWGTRTRKIITSACMHSKCKQPRCRRPRFYKWDRCFLHNNEALTCDSIWVVIVNLVHEVPGTTRSTKWEAHISWEVESLHGRAATQLSTLYTACKHMRLKLNIMHMAGSILC